MSTQMGEPGKVRVLHCAPINALELRIRGEYREMPGLRLKPEQAMRLFSLDRDTCQQALDNLVREGFLQRDHAGRYVSANGGY
jgi:DNA-binding GntR family transcriptional regulator